VEPTLRQLAEQHLSKGIGRKERNAQLRELGYDPAGPVGKAYRFLFRAAREAKQAADRKEALRNRRPGLTHAQLSDFAGRYTAAWCSHEPQRVAEFFAVDGSLTINRGAPAIGRAAIATAVQGFMSAFPDLVVTMNGLGVSGSTVYYHWILSGTNTEAGGTGRRVQISGYEEWTFDREGRITRSLGYFDEAACRAQLAGVIGSSQ
jgi:SnoaL-like polyketide cyclase